jgi:molybdenum cofactor synthesis domain-containing protein
MATAAILIIGNEILSGKTQDTHVQWIAHTLLPQGIDIGHVRIIQDREDDIVHHINDIRLSYDYIFTTGGIGATHDDITIQSIAKAFQRELVECPKLRKFLNAYKIKNPHDYDDVYERMVFIPSGNDVGLIENDDEFFPSFYISNVFVLAGMPDIMKLMMDRVARMLPRYDPILTYSLNFKVNENRLAQDLQNLQHRYVHLKVGSYPYQKDHCGTIITIQGLEKHNFYKACKELDYLFEQY